MLNAINTKLLLAVLAALTAIGAFLVHEHQVSERTAAEAKKAALILEQQKAQTEAAQKENDDLKKTIEREHRKHANDNKNQSKTWRTYVP